ncbi:MAG: hypothetical protein NT031_03870 [Planctomycetota bacterium]|nr:hypothetical protein [Planctomycetota bacterium]
MNDNSQAAGVNEEPLPPRRRMRWWGWVLVVLGTLVCTAAGTWFGWGYVGQSRLNKLLAEIRSRGEPVEWKDFAEAPVPDGQNAVPLYQKASDMLSDPKGKYTQADVVDFSEMIRYLTTDKAFRRQHGREVEAILDFSRDSLALLRQAADRPGADFKMDFHGSALGVKLPPVANMTDLADAGVLAALRAHEAGRDAQALQSLRDTMALGRCLGRSPLLILQMVSMACYRDVFPAVEQCAPDFRIGPEPGASAAMVRELIRELSDSTPVTQGWTWAMLAERAFLYDTLERLRRGELSLPGLIKGSGSENLSLGGVTEWLLRPLLTGDEVTCLRAQTSMAEGIRQATYPAALRKMNEEPDSIEAVRRRCTDFWFAVGHPMGAILLPAYSVDGHYEHLALRRLAATALAMRLYEVEKGKPVTALADLVAAG